MRAELPARLPQRASTGLMAMARSLDLADLVVLITTLYALRVVNPVFTVPDFPSIELNEYMAAASEGTKGNQLFWIGITTLALLTMLRDWRNTLPRILVENSCVVALTALALLSTIWAFEPSITFRRAVQETMIVTCILVGAYRSLSAERCVWMLYAALVIALVVHMLALPLPTSYDWRGDFRAFYDDKNGLGAISIMGFLAGVAVHGAIASPIGRLANLAYMAGWVLVLTLTHSKTSLGLLALVPIVFAMLHLTARTTRLGIGILFLVALAAFGTFLAFLVVGSGIPLIRLAGLVSSDPTFTGRNVIWNFVLEMAMERPVLGFGYQSFWGSGDSAPNLRAELQFIHILNQAHNGYLDILLSLGVVGLLLMLGAIIQGMAAASRIRTTSPMAYRFCWLLIIFVLLHNGTESSLYRSFVPPWLFFLFALAIAGRIAAEAARTEKTVPQLEPGQ